MFDMAYVPILIEDESHGRRYESELYALLSGIEDVVFMSA
jgi:hypothetical protein